MSKSDFVEEKLPFSPSHGTVTSIHIPIKVGDRVAKCQTCSRMSKTDSELPFFTQRPEMVTDLYYCGCRGWD